jgi:hypothetical protein
VKFINIKMATPFTSRNPDTTVLSSISKDISKPDSMIANIAIEIDVDGYTPYFGSLYHDILRQLYPEGLVANMEYIITHDEFVLVCCAILWERISHCDIRMVTVINPLYRQLGNGFKIPHALAIVINRIGSHIIYSNMTQIYPTLPDNVNPPVLTPLVIQKFSQLINAAEARNLISLDYLGNEPGGTGWWALRAQDYTNRGTAAVSARGSIPAVAAVPPGPATGNANNVIVMGAFYEWGPEDAILSAIVQNGFNGVIPITQNDLLFRSDPITNVLNTRTDFNAN